MQLCLWLHNPIHGYLVVLKAVPVKAVSVESVGYFLTNPAGYGIVQTAHCRKMVVAIAERCCTSRGFLHST